MTLLLMAAKDFAFSAVAALGFSVLFNVPQRLILPCILSGALGHLARTLLVFFGVTLVPASFVGGFCVGILAELFFRKYDAPTSIFIVPGVITMIPGIFAHSCMSALLRTGLDFQGDVTSVLVEAGKNGVVAFLIIGAISVGAVLPKILFRRDI